MSSEQTLNQKKSRSTKIKRSYKKYPNKEKKGKQAKIEQQKSQVRKKFPEPIIYDPENNQRNMPLAADDAIFKDNGQIARVVMKITKYYLDLHKDMINTYNLVYFQTLQDISNLSWDGMTIPVRSMNYPLDINNNIYSSITDTTAEESLQLVDSIINKNLDTFIKSIELSQRFYKEVIDSYLNCIEKS